MRPNTWGLGEPQPQVRTMVRARRRDYRRGLMADSIDGPAGEVPRELQQLWLSVVRSAWTSLAVIPADESVSARLVAEELVGLSRTFDLGAFELVDAEGVSVQEAGRMAHGLARPPGADPRVVVALDSPLAHPGAVALLVAADAALVVARLGTSSLAGIRDVTELAGSSRVLGCITLRDEGESQRYAREA